MNILRLFRRYAGRVRRIEQEMEWGLTGRWVLYSAAVGVGSALAAIALSEMIHWFSGWALGAAVGYHPPGIDADATAIEAGQSMVSRPWLLLLIPTLGGLASGYLVFRFAPEAEGHGTDAVIEAFHHRSGDVRARVGWVKALASAITIGTGGSAGKEGPIAQIGAALGSWIGHRLSLSREDRRLLLIAGIAGGIGAIFRSPLGGAFFAVEVIYREDIETRGLMPATVAAITGYSVYSMLWESESVFSIPEFTHLNPPEYLIVLVFAAVCSVLGIFFVRFFYRTHDLFGRLPLPKHVITAFGGLLLGLIALRVPAVLGSSYAWIQQAMLGHLSLSFMAVLVVGKILATSATVGSGGSGGVFAPSLVIGGMLGGVFGAAGSIMFPEIVTQPEVFVLIGMATFFSGVANVPIATTIMISEMTGSYALLVPLILGGVVTQVLARKWSLYRQQVRTRADSPAHRTDMSPDLISTIRVEQVVEPTVYYHTLAPYHDLYDVMTVFGRTKEVVLPVVGDDIAHRYVGLVLLDSMKPYLDGNKITSSLAVRDVMVPFTALRMRDTLEVALERFEQFGYPELPVVDGTGLIVSFIRPSQVIFEYHRAYLREQAYREANQE